MPDPNEPQYPDPIQGGDEPVTRQKGNYDEMMAKQRMDAEAGLPPVIQGSPDIFTTRQAGLGQQVGPDGTLIADHAAQPGTPIVVSDRPAPPPAPDATLPAPVVGVTRSDDGGADPRDASGGPQVFSAGQLPVIKKAPIVPVVSDQAAPKVEKAQAAPNAIKAKG